MSTRTVRLVVVAFASVFLMWALLAGSAWLTYHGQASRLTDVLNVLGFGAIPFLVGALVSWQLRDVLRAIATTFIIGLMGASWAGACALTFAQLTEDDLGTMCFDISFVAFIPYLLLGVLAGLCGRGVAHLLAARAVQNEA